MGHCPNLNCPTCHPQLPDRPCNRCGRALPFVDTDHRFEQYDNALHVYLDGGYGERIDRISNPWRGNENFTHAVLCQACTDELMATEPWLRAMVAPTREEWLGGEGEIDDFAEDPVT